MHGQQNILKKQNYSFISHASNTTALQSNIFLLEHVGCRSQKSEGRAFPGQKIKLPRLAIKSSVIVSSNL